VQEDVATPFEFDARGRLYLRYGWAVDQTEMRPNSPYGVLEQLRRVDLAAGDDDRAGLDSRAEVVCVARVVSHGGAPVGRPLVDPDPGRSRPRDRRWSPEPLFWVGEDACVLDQHRLTCVLLEAGEPFRPTSRPVLYLGGLRTGGGAPEMVVVVADEAARAAGHEEATQLWLVRLRDVPGQPREYFLAGGRKLEIEDVASTGSQVAVLDGQPAGPVRLRLMSFGAGEPVIRELPLPPVAYSPDPERLPWSPPRIRPGRSEAWALATDGQLAILRADGSHEFLGVAPSEAPDASTLIFPAQIIWTADELAYEITSGAPPTVRRGDVHDGRALVGVPAGRDDPPGGRGQSRRPQPLQIPVTPLRGVAEIVGQGRLLLWSSVGYADQVQVRLHDRDTLAALGALDEVRRVIVVAGGCWPWSPGGPSTI
jgi:hypothetical protein